jgi:ribosomal protein S11
VKDAVLWRLCVHEAAHATVAHATGTRVHSVAVTRNDADVVAGVCRLVDPPAVAALAGGAGEAVVFGSDGGKWGSPADLALAAAAIEQSPEGCGLAHYTIRARGIAHRHEAAIRHLAALLYVAGELSGAEVTAALAGRVEFGSEHPTITAALAAHGGSDG